MTYLSASTLAEQAEASANLAKLHTDDDTVAQHMAQAVADLSAAVADLAKSLHEEKHD
ncbi:MAG: hypothetical protein QOF35_851 [Actinomycetota bacterium]|nr:hypothetical protein [Actinomycetota bacterium]